MCEGGAVEYGGRNERRFKEKLQTPADARTVVLRLVFRTPESTSLTEIDEDMAASAKDPPLKLTSMLIGISLIKILVFYKIFFLNELRVKFLSSLKKKSVKNSE